MNESSVTTRVALSINVKYLPDWGVKEGLRELLQNHLDAVDQNGGASSITIDEADGVFHCANDIGTLERKALLLGTTTKADDAKARGQFGEGLKLGTLALVRAGCSVVIATGSERWEASLAPAPEYGGETVLCWDITTLDEAREGVQVTVAGLDDEAPRYLRSSFRTLIDDLGETVETETGTLLLDERFAGHVFVKGILVQVCPKQRLKYGYDLKSAKVDRDRRVVSEWDLDNACAHITGEAEESGAIQMSELLDAALAGHRDLEDARYRWDTAQIRRLLEAFRARFGQNAVPVNGSTLDTLRKDLEAAGYKPVDVPYHLCAAFEQVISIAELARSARAAVLDSAPKLTPRQKSRLKWAIGELEAVLPAGALDGIEVNVVTFRSEKVAARTDTESRHVFLAQSVLAASRGATVMQLARQVAKLLPAKAGADSFYDVVEALAIRWADSKNNTAEAPSEDAS